MQEYNITEQWINKYYNLEVIINKNDLGMLSMSRVGLRQSILKTYKNVKLININGFGNGQVHFITDDDSCLLIPWCYIVSMIPIETVYEIN